MFPVSWAGEKQSVQWLDIGREFTEVWHHGSQIRDAVGAGSFSDPRWLKAVLQVALHALPRAYRDVPGGPDRSVAIRITGPRLEQWDFSLFKSISVTERVRLQLRVESFNFFNHPNFGLPNGGIGNAAAGTVSSTVGSPRQNQFALKLLF